MQELEPGYHYVYKGNWGHGCKEGFGMELFSEEKLMQHRGKINDLQEEALLTPRYTGFFKNNKRMGEGCVELRDQTMELWGYYLGRYENGKRHGVGQRIQVLSDQRFEITHQLFKGGVLAPSHADTKFQAIDLMSNIYYFGYLGIVPNSAPLSEDEQTLYFNRDLKVSDFQFLESQASLFDPARPVDAASEYAKLRW